MGGASDSLSHRLKHWFPSLVLICVVFSEVNFINLEINTIPLRLSIGDVAFAALLVTFFYVYSSDIIRLIRGDFFLFFVALFFILISFFTSVPGNDLWLVSLKFIVKVCLVVFLLFFAFHLCPLSERSLVPLHALMIFINVVGLIEFATPSRIEWLLVFFNPQEMTPELSQQRASSFFANPNPYGAFNAFYVVAVLSVSCVYRRLSRGIIFFPAICLGLAGVVISGSRDAIFTLGVGVLLLLVYLGLKKRREFIYLIVSIFVFCLAGYLMLDAGVGSLNRLGRIFPVVDRIACDQPVELADFVPEYELGERDLIWREGARMFLSSPILGIGANQFLYRNELDPGHYHVHNIFGEVLVNHGIVGFGLMGILLFHWFRRSRSSWQLIIILTFFASHTFDCFIIHDLIWMIAFPFIVALTLRPPEEIFVSDPEHALHR